MLLTQVTNGKDLQSEKFSFELKQSDIVPINVTGVVDTGGKFTDGVIDTCDGALRLVNIPGFLKNIQMTQMSFLGSWGGR